MIGQGKRVTFYALMVMHALSACSEEAVIRPRDDSTATRERENDAPRGEGYAGSGEALDPPAGAAGAPSVLPNPQPSPPMQNGATPSCGGDRYEAKHEALTIYTLFDESGSMLLWWLPVTEAFSAFVNDPRSAGIKIGLKFFGLSCEPEAYSVPDVPIGALPENAQAIADQLALRIPLAETPTAQALEGATLAMTDYAAKHPDEKVVILLVTDASTGIGEGEAEDCFSTLEQASTAAAKARMGTPSIETHVLGLGDAIALNVLSQAGGTGNALSADPSMSERVIEAMHEIRRRALPCDYALPAGASDDPKLVNLEFSTTGKTPSTVPGVATAAECDATLGGWYYDDPTTPKRIVTCPATCSSLGDAAEVKVVLGCPTLGPD